MKFGPVQVEQSVAFITGSCEYSKTGIMRIQQVVHFEMRLSDFVRITARLQPRRLMITAAAVGCKPGLAGCSLPIERRADDRFAFPTVPGTSCCFF